MSATALNDAPHPDLSLGSVQTLGSRALPPHPEPATRKRVCFYKSGDPQFTGHRMVISSRTFKTFDALLDALSKKVPLPFGVRTITTPRGTHAVRALEDVQDGGSYLCSDQKKVKPFNLDEVHKKQVPWNTTRPVSAGRQARRDLVRQLVKRNAVTTRVVKMAENTVTVRTPKRLTVYKNREPSIKRVIVVHRRTAPNFEALLDYLSQVMQFPVVKLYTEDGRRIEGLPALLLCSGIVVAAGNEPFRIGNYNLQGPAKMQSRISESSHPAQTETLLQEKKIPAGTFSRSRNFSLSSERFLVEQINKSLNGNLAKHNRTKNESMETEDSQAVGSDEVETRDGREGAEDRNNPIMPNEDDIEKSFRVNEDGSMTVEMKVHLTIKQEEMIHWTTTLSRNFINSQQRALYNSKPESGANSLDVTNDSGKESNGPHSLDSKEINTLANKSVEFIKEERENYGSDTSSEKPKPVYRRLPTPGPRQRRKEASVENIKTVSETEVQESAYSYMERTAHGELTEGYCVVSRSSSSSTRTVTKPGMTESGEVKQKKSHSFRSSGVAEVLQLQNNGTMGIKETVVHIYESQGMCDNYYANTQVDVDNKPGYHMKDLPQSKPGSTDSGPSSSSNDCDVDFTRQSITSNSQDGGKMNMLSLSSACSTPPKQINNNSQSLLADEGKQTSVECTSETTEKKIVHPAVAKEQDSDDKSTVDNKHKTKKKISKKSKKTTSTSESSGLGEKIKCGAQGSSKDLQMTSDALSHTGSEKKTSSAESDKHKAVKDKNKKVKAFESSPKSRNVNLDTGNQRWPDKELKVKDKTIKDISHKLNTNRDSQGRKINKSSSDIRSPANPAPLVKKLQKPKSMNGVRTKSTKKQEMSESVSLPVLQSPSTSVNQYVENWLKKMEPDSVPYDDEKDHPEVAPKAVFKIGSDSTNGSDAKSDPEKESLENKGLSPEDYADEKPVPLPPVQIRCEGELIEPQKTMGFCKSMPILRVPSEQEGLERMHKSSENLAPPDSSEIQNTEVSIRSGMKPVLQQLCLSVQSIKQAFSQTRLTPVEKEKSSSLPDFSSQVASAFGSPSRALLSFLSVMTLRDGLSVLYKDESQASNTNDYPEALQVMQSLEKISHIQDEEELKASLTSLQGSTSSKLKQNWRDFQEHNVFDESPPLSPRLSDHEFAVEVDLDGETEDPNKQQHFDIEQLLHELNMPEDLHREISSLVEGELKYFNETDDINDPDNASQKENEDGSLSGSLQKAADMEVEKESIAQDNGTTDDDTINDPKEPESREMCLTQPQSPVSETIENDIGNEDSGIAVPNHSPEGNGSDSSKPEVLENHNNKEMNADNMQEKVMNKDKNAEGNCSLQLFSAGGEQVSELCDDQNHNTEKEDNATTDDIIERDSDVEEEETVQNMKETSELSEASEPNESENKDDEMCSPTSEQKMTDVAGDEDSDLSDDQDINSEREDDFTPENKEQDLDVEEDDTIENVKETNKQSDASEPDETDVKCSYSGSDREASELNEECQNSTTEECAREQTAHSDFEQTDSEEGGQEQETKKSILSENVSLQSETSLPHHDTDGEFREQTLESSSQGDDHVTSPDFKQEDATPEVSECEDPDLHCDKSHSQHGGSDENRITPEAEYEKTIENGLGEEHEVDNESSAGSEHPNPDAEPSSPVSDPEAMDEDMTNKPCKVQTLEEGSATDRKDSSVEEGNVEEDDYDSLPDSQNNVKSVGQSCADDTKESLERESCSSTITSEPQIENVECLGMEHGYHYLLQPNEISQDLLDLINSALLSSTLIVTCDSNGNVRIEPDKCKMREMFMACQRTDGQYGQKCLPSPNTSDLSDYRPETSENGGYQSQELFTESGEEEIERLRIFREILKQSSEKPKRINHVKENDSPKSSTSMKSSRVKSSSTAKSPIKEPLNHSRSPSDKSSLDGNSGQHMTLKDNKNSGNGVLIDKGRWLLKENHLIRNSPPASIGMYGNGDTTSVDTAQDNRSEGSANHCYENQASPMAVISSSELEDMAKPQTPKCMYYNMPHSSDSDPLLDAQSVKSGSGGRDARWNKELKVCPMGETSKMWAKKNGSMSSFASVEFKLPDGKVHPQEASRSGANRSQSQDSHIVQEEEPKQWLNLRCGQHCPIL